MDNHNNIPVWDILIRLFHWFLVVFFTIAYVIEEGLWHIYSGYIVLGLISFRVLWGLIGSRYARFSHFIYSPKNVFIYLASLASPHPKRYIGHNPAGGWMIVALLVCLFVVTLSGIKLYAVEEGRGPLASIGSDTLIVRAAYASEYAHEENEEEHEAHEFWEEIHEISANLTLFLIFLHVAGVFVAGYLHKENLVKAMFTGKKHA